MLRLLRCCVPYRGTPQVASSPAGVRVDVGSWQRGTPAVFLGYRTANNFDAPLAGFGMTDRVRLS